jgi:hypothetical protein
MPDDPNRNELTPKNRNRMYGFVPETPISAIKTFHYFPSEKENYKLGSDPEKSSDWMSNNDRPNTIFKVSNELFSSKENGSLEKKDRVPNAALLGYSNEEGSVLFNKSIVSGFSSKKSVSRLKGCLKKATKSTKNKHWKNVLTTPLDSIDNCRCSVIGARACGMKNFGQKGYRLYHTEIQGIHFLSKLLREKRLLNINLSSIIFVLAHQNGPCPVCRKFLKEVANRRNPHSRLGMPLSMGVLGKKIVVYWTSKNGKKMSETFLPGSENGRKRFNKAVL